MCYVNTPPRTLPFGTRPLKFNTHTKHGLYTCIAKRNTLCRDCFSSTTKVCERSGPDSPKNPSSALAPSGPTEPLPVSRIVQAQLLGNFGCRHCIKQFLFNDRKPARPHRASCSRTIVAVDDADQTVYSPVVLASHAPDLVLAFHVPYDEMQNLAPAASIPTTHILISVSPTTYSNTEDPLQTTDSSCKTSAWIVQVFLFDVSAAAAATAAAAAAVLLLLLCNGCLPILFCCLPRCTSFAELLLR